MATKEFFVSGMTCGHCVASVKGEIAALPGVTSVDVDLVSGGRSKVSVSGNPAPPDDALTEAVARAGYDVTP